jgi:rRNA processing protein Krr1/Pno1
MQSQALTTTEVLATLRRRVVRAEAAGLSPAQAVAVVSHGLKLETTKLVALLDGPERV